jgi:hypothetical protein
MPRSNPGSAGNWTFSERVYFKELCPPDSTGQRRPGEKARWIPAVSNPRKYYRHLLAGPYRIYDAHSDNPNRVRALLCTPAHEISELYEQLASRQEMVTNAGLMEACTILYVDPVSGKPKNGARGKGKASPRRLAKMVNQLGLTWDLYSVTAQGFLELLPAEFDRFRSGDQR